MYNDPQDGWRSCGQLYHVDDSIAFEIDKDSIKKLKDEILYFIPDEKIIVKYNKIESACECQKHYYEFFNADTNQLILKIGTDNYDDWYPCCIFEYYPENLSCNIGKELI